MELIAGKVAVVTGAASGIGLALAERLARNGLGVVMADVERDRLGEAAATVAAQGAEVLAVPTDVSDEQAVQHLADAAYERFGAVHLVCNNAGVAAKTDSWFGPLSGWQWVMGVNFWGVVHGVRAFLPRLVGQGGGHIVNTASVAGLLPGFGASYDASKHAVVALTEDLYRAMTIAGLPVGVSVLCPGWVRTNITDAERNWPEHLGEQPPQGIETDVVLPHLRRVIDEGMPPAAVADRVLEAVEAGRFWVFTESEFVALALRRWHSIAEAHDPDTGMQIPGMPPPGEVLAEIQRLLGTDP